MCRYLSSRLASSSTITGAMLSPLRSVVLLIGTAILLSPVWPWRARELVASAVFHLRPYDVASRGPVARIATITVAIRACPSPKPCPARSADVRTLLTGPKQLEIGWRKGLWASSGPVGLGR